MATREIDHRKVLEIYAKDGATAAAEEAGVSKRTVQRWAAKAGVKSGYKAPIRVLEPSAASYMRGDRSEEAVEAYRDANRAAKDRRLARFEKGESVPQCGMASTYSNYDCRGAACKAAWSKYLRDKRHGRETSSSEQILLDGEGLPFSCPRSLNPLDE